MSLHHAAQHLAAQGRGPDETLVHMSGKELAGLQALAKAHGGSLTTNPKTGLPEAGFLDDILPTVLGAAGMYFGLDPMTTAALVGGEETMRTGDLGKGIVSGLGAYGGAGLTEGVMNAGESALAQQAGLGAGENLVSSNADKLSAGLGDVLGEGGWFNLKAGMPAGGMSALTAAGAAATPAIMGMLQPKGVAGASPTNQMIRPYTVAMNPQAQGNMVGNKQMIGSTYQPGQDTSERLWFQPQFTAQTPYKAAGGGLMDLQSMAAGGGPVEAMSNANAIGQNTGFPQADIQGHAYATPWQTPISENIVTDDSDTGVNSMTGEERFAAGGISSLGAYASGGNPRLLKGPGDGMSDNIPAVIGDKQPARLADGEFVVPADVVSHLGNGSTEAGAKQLYKMMDRIRQQRTGKKKQAPEVNPAKAMPA